MKTRLFSTILLLVMSAAGVFGDVLRVGSGSPYSSITSALAAASPGDEIWVSAGTYREAELIIPSGVSVYGGFTGSETQLSERNFTQNVTILDGSGSHRVATVSGRLDGFTLRNGRTGDNGGGAYIKGGGTLANCIAFANEAGYDGGAVFAEDGGTVKNSLLTGNRAGNDGAAISGLGAYSAVHVTATGNEFTNAPEIKKVLNTPVPIVAGQQLNVAEPDITSLDEVDPHGSTVLLKGWELDGHAISMPYTVTYADNGKKLRFWAANAVGVGMSNEVTVTVTWTVTSAVQLITPKAVCEGTTLADAGITEPSFSPAPANGVTYEWSIDGTPIPGLDYALQYSDNGKLLTCEVKSGDIVGAKTPAVRLAVMKAPEILLPAVTALSIEEGQQLCLPSPYVASNGSDLTSQGWHYGPDSDNLTAFTSCDKAIKAMDGKHLYYTASNGCGDAVTLDYATLTVTNAVGEFLQQEPVICDGMKLGDAIGFADGDNAGDYYIGTEELTGTKWADVASRVLTSADNLKVLKFVYNGGKGERRLTLQVHAIPSLTKDLVQDEHNMAVCMGASYTLEAGVDGESLGYRWQTATGDDAPATEAGWSEVTGGSSSALRFSVGGDAWYRCLATGVCIDRAAGTTTTISGKTYLVSTAVKVSHTTKPDIPEGFTFANADILNVCEGTLFSAVFKNDNKPSVLKAGEDVTPGTASEGWMLGGVKVTAGQTITAADNGKALGYWAMNRCGESTATFNTLTLKVSGKVSILQSPADQTVNEGGRVRLSVLTAAPAECTYLWEIHDATTGGWSAAPAGTDGNDKAVYTFVTPSGDDVPADRRNADSYTDQYRCVITSSNACGTGDVQKSDAATVTVLRSSTEVAITAQPSDGEVCAGDNHALTVTATNRTTLSFQWYRDGRKVTMSDGEIVAPAGNNATGTTSVFKAKVSGTYYCLVTSVDNPTGTRSDEAAVTVHPIPAVITNIANATICKGSTTTLKYVVSGDDVTYQWTKQSASGTSLGSGSSLDVTPDATTTYVVKVTAKCSDKVDAGLFEKKATVTVNDKPAITGGPSDVIRLCEGTEIGAPTAVAVDFKGSAGISQSWTLNGIDIDPTTYMVSTADQGKVIAYRAKNGCGETINDFAGKVTLNIDKRPQLLQSPSDVTVEEGTQVRLSVLTGDKNVTYKWVSTSDETKELSNTSAYSYTPKELTGAELTGGKRTEQYYCIITAPAGSTCKGDNNDLDGADKDKLAFEQSSIATVEVQRKTTSITITAQPAEAYPEACAIDDAGTINKTVFASGISITAEGRGALTFTWYKNGKAVTAGDGTVENGSETTLPESGDRDPLTPTVQQTSTFHPTAAGTYFCQVSSSDNASGVRSEQVVLTVHPPVKFTSNLEDNTETLCEDSNLSLSVVATGDNRSYQWQWKAKDAGDQTYAAIAGETDSRLRTAVDGNKTYRCVLTAACADGQTTAATKTVTSKTHTVTMSQKPTITLDKVTPTTSTFSLCEGAELNPTAFATVSVDYHGNATNKAEWWTLGGQQAEETYPVKSTDNNKALGYYAQNGCGVATATLPLALEVNDMPLILMQPQGTEVQMGSQVRLTVRASVGKGTLKYQWQRKGATDGDFVNVPAGNATATTPAYVFEAEEVTTVAPDNVQTTYRCHITLEGSECSYDANSEEAIVTVTRRKSSISVTAQPASYGICSSEAYTPLSVTVSGTANFTYAWYKQGTASPVQETGPKNIGTPNYDSDSYLPKAPGIYYCKVTSEDDPTGVISQPATVTRYKEPENITLTDASPSMCEGSVRVLGVASDGENLTYEWHRSADVAGTTDEGVCTGGNAQTYTPQGLAKGTYYYYCVVANSNCADKAKKSDVITLTVNQSAAITTQPLSKTICSGTALSLNVVATTDKADGFAWYVNGSKIAGQTSATLNVAAADVKGGVYTCEVSSAHCGSVISAPALVTVAGIPTVELGSAAGLTACRGDLITLPSPVVEANGSIIVPDKTGWYTTNKDALVSSALVSGDVTYKYRLSYKCSDEQGATVNEVANTPEYKIAMTPQPKFAAGELQNVTLNTGVEVTVTNLVKKAITVGTGDTYHYLLGGTPVTLPYKVSAADDGKKFECVAVNACGEEVKLNSTALLKVNSLEITTQPVSQTYCEGVTGKTLVVSTNITPTGCQWYKNGVALSSQPDIAKGSQKATYTLGSATTDAGVYTCEVKLGTLTVVSSPAVVTVNAKPGVVAAAESVAVCSGSPLTLQCEATGAGLTYSWKKEGNNTELGKSSSLTVAAPASGKYICTVTGTCNTPVTKTVTVTVNTPVKITRQPIGQEKCVSASYADLTVAADGTSVEYLWYKDGVALAAGTGFKTATYKPTATGTYYCVVSNACGSETSAAAVISEITALTGTAIISADRVTICQGESVQLKVTGVNANNEAPVYTWSGDSKTWTTNNPVLTVSPTANASYTCKVTSACNTSGTATAQAASVTVHTPIAITTQPKSLTSCTLADLTVAATGTGSETATNYTWYKDGAATAVKAKTYPVVTLNADAADGKPHTYTCLVKGTCNEVMSAPAVVEKAIALSVGNITADRTTVCPGESVTLTLSATGDGIVYAWTGDKTGATTVLGTSSTLSVNPTANTTYTCKVTGTCNTTGVTKQQAITVTQVPTITGVLKAVEKKEGETVIQTDIQTTAPASSGNTLTWTLNDTPVKFGYTVSAADHGKVFKVTATNACGLSATLGSTSTLSVRTAPRILEQPRGVTLCEGTGTVTLTVKASGSGLSHQWMKDGVPVTDAPGAGGNDVVGGATDATLTLTKPAASRSGVYTCRVSGSGGDAVVSAPAVVTVNANVAITSQPKAVTICAGNSATLQVEATGATGYQWKKGDTDIANARSATLTVGDAGNYKCVVTGKCGAAPTSAVAAVTVTTPVKITRQPVGETKCATDAFTALSVTAANATGYQWYNAAGTTISGATGATYSPNQAADTYYCVASNACGSETSASAVLTRHAALAVSPLAGTVTTCIGTPVSIGVNVTAGSPAKYSWTGGAGTAPTASVSVANTYTCTVTDVCGKTATANVKVTTKPATVITDISNSGAARVCETATMPKLTVAATGDGTLSYQWYRDGATVGTNANNYIVSKADLGAHNYSVKVTGGCGNAISAPVVVEVVKAPVVSLPTTGIIATVGDVITLPVPSIEANGSVIAQAATGWCSTANETLINSWKVSGTGAQTFRYKVGYTCGATTNQKLFSGNLTVTPQKATSITTHPQDQIGMCDYSALKVVADGSGTLEYLWYKDGTALTSVYNDTYKTASLTVKEDGVYTCRVTGATGSVFSSPALVRKSVAVSGTLTAKADRTTLCKGESVTLSATGVSGDGLSYEWKTGATTVGYGATVSVSPSATADYVCTAKDACGGTKSSNNVTVTVNNPVVITAQPMGGGVFNATKLLSVSTMGNVTGYQWYKDGVTIGTNSSSYTVPNAVGVHTYYCLVEGKCGNVTSTAVQVSIGQKPTFSNTGDRVVSGRIGSVYGYPAPPVVAMNNCELVSQGWVVSGSDASVAFLNPGAEVNDVDDGKQIVWQVRYKDPAGSTDYVNSPVMGTLRPWNEPSLYGAVGTVYAEVKAGATWVMPTHTVFKNKTTLVSEKWVYGAAHTAFDASLTVDFDKHRQQPLYKEVVYTIPGSTVKRTVYLHAGLLYPWRALVLQPYTKQTWDVCTQKTFIESGHPFPTVLYEANECTIIGHDWIVNGVVVNEGQNPTTAQFDETLQYRIKYKTPEDKEFTVSRDIATLRTATAVPILILDEAKAGNPNVQVIGANVDKAFNPTVINLTTNEYTLAKTHGETMQKADQGKIIRFTAYNGCGTAIADGKVELSGKVRGNDYYKGIPGFFSVIETPSGAKWIWVGVVRRVEEASPSVMRFADETWPAVAKEIAMRTGWTIASRLWGTGNPADPNSNWDVETWTPDGKSHRAYYKTSQRLWYAAGNAL